MRILVLLSTFFVISCATLDREIISEFQMTSENTWRFQARTASNYKKDDPDDENIRLQWIKDYAVVNDCSNFEITSRVWTKKPTDNFMQTGFSEEVGVLVYEGKCL